MFLSIPVATVFGITVRIHWMWIAWLLGVAVFAPSDPLAWVLWTLMLFALVFLHELGHSLMAKAFKIRVIDITLWPLGGMARMTEIPEKPHVEALIALAGPAVNLALAALALPPLLLFGELLDFADWGHMMTSFSGVLTIFVGMNLAMGVFNLVPAFPMDGGRVLRSFLGVFSDWLTATRRAVLVGKLFAVAMIVGGFFLEGFSLIPLIGLFIWWQGSAELFAVRVRHGDVPGWSMAGPRPASYSAGPPPESHDERPDDESGARRPADNPLAGPRGPLSKEDIEKLESFRGRLRGPSDPGE